MRLRSPIAAILLVALAVAMACTSSGEDETPTPTQASGEPTATPNRSSPRTEPQPTPTAASRSPGPVDTPKGPPSSPGSPERPLTASLPSDCVTLDGEPETFISNSINVEGVSAIAAVAAVGATGDGILFIASELVGTGRRGMPVAVWGTFDLEASRLTYENTWAANSVAAEWSSLPGRDTSEEIYGAFDGFEQARECAEIAADSIFVSLSPTPGPGMPVSFDYVETRCVPPTEPTTAAIKASLRAGPGEATELRSPIMLSPKSFGQGATVWRYGADLEGPQEYDGAGPYPVWLKIVERDGSARYYSENNLAANISDLPRPPSNDRPPASPADVAHLERCIAESKREFERPVFQEPELVITPCLSPSAEVQERIARFLNEDARLRNSATVVVEQRINGRVVEGPLTVMAANTGKQGEDNQYAVWMIYDYPISLIQLPFTVSLNEAAGDVSVLPALSPEQLDTAMDRYLTMAVGCASRFEETGEGTDILPLERVFDPGRCLTPLGDLQALLRESITDPGVELTHIQMVDSQIFEPVRGLIRENYWFIAAAVDDGEETRTAVWLYISPVDDPPSRGQVQSASHVADEISDFEPSMGVEPTVTSWDGFLEAKDCVAAALEEDRAAEEDAVAEATAEAVEEMAEPETSE